MLSTGKKARGYGFLAGIECIFVILLFSGCNRHPSSSSGERVHQVPSGQPIRLAFVPNAPTAFWDMAQHGLRKFEKETGVHVDLKFPPTGSVEEQNQILEGLESQNYSGVALSVIAPQDQVRDINRAAAQMNVVTTDSDAPLSNRLAFVGPKQYDAGVAAGKEILRLFPKGAKIALFCGDLTAENAVERVKGIKAATQGKNVEVVAMKEDGKDRTRARSQVEDVITAYPQVNLLVGLWSYNGPAIRDALIGSGKAGKIKSVVFDEEQGTLEGIRTGVIDATVVLTPFDYGYQSAKLLYDLARNGEKALPPGGVIDTGFKVLHASDLPAFTAMMDEEKKW